MKTPVALTPEGLIIALATMDMKAMVSTALVITLFSKKGGIFFLV
tara:strand:+ start:2188 stop:2322 length:135 start_codon:yes stop_codon:yes gene_type:complete